MGGRIRSNGAGIGAQCRAPWHEQGTCNFGQALASVSLGSPSLMDIGDLMVNKTPQFLHLAHGIEGYQIGRELSPSRRYSERVELEHCIHSYLFWENP